MRVVVSKQFELWRNNQWPWVKKNETGMNPSEIQFKLEEFSDSDFQASLN